MDTEEHLEIQEKKQGGYPYTNEGPYYYHTWWESYKGGIKGKLGGIVIGAAIGAVTGIVATAVVALAGAPLSAGIALSIVGGFAAGGLLYGVHEFDTIGKITGGIAAANETAEARLKAFEKVKFAELKQEIDEVKALVTGKPAPEKKIASDRVLGPEGENYRIRHYNKVTPPKQNKYVFWRIAAVGLAVGLAAGALLALGGFSHELLTALGSAGAELGVKQELAASMLAMGAIGASFGINRDIFRQVFDQTDLWFRGLFHRGNSPAQKLDVAQAETHEVATTVTPVRYEGIQYPASETYHRDKVVAQATQALFELDHTKARPH